MANITLEQVGLFVAYLVALVSGVSFLLKKLKTWISKAFKEEIQPINKSIDGMKDSVESVDMNSCKNFLVRCLSDFESDIPVSEIEKERFWEQYEHYQKIGGNSYVTRKVEQLKNEGKL